MVFYCPKWILYMRAPIVNASIQPGYNPYIKGYGNYGHQVASIMKMAEIIRYTILLGYTLFYITGSCEGEPLDEIGDEYIPIMVRRNDFFLKVAKSVPHIGKRNDFFFTKAVKSIPRIERRNDFFLKAAKSVPRIGRRDELTTVEKEATVAWPWFRDHDFIPRVMKKDTDSLEETNTQLEEPNKEREEPRFQPIV